MHLTHLGRTIAGLAVLGVASSALAMPAHASTTARETAAAAAFVATHAPGTMSAADLEDEGEFIDTFEGLADVACAIPGQAFTLSSDLLLINIVSSPGGPVAALISADINTDSDVSSYEKTCTFAFLVAEEGTTFDGSYSLTVASDSFDGGGPPADQPVTIGGTVSGEYSTSSPIFTNQAVYANASLNGGGTTSKLTLAQRTVTDTVATPKSAKQKKAAKKAYDKTVKAAKKKYKKAGKTKKAKKAMNKKIATAKKKYTRAKAPTLRRVNRVETYNARTPWSIGAVLDSSHSLTD